MKNLTVYLTLLIAVFTINLFAQEDIEKGGFNINVDIVSRYVWRGLSLSSSPNIQPNLAYSSGDGSFSAGVWGSYSTSSNFAEVDLFVSYTWKYFNISIWDYFVMDESAARNKYFQYDKDSTGHSYEAILVLGNFNIPIQITSGVFFYGADRNNKGNNYYSMYFEAAYNFTNGSNDFSVFVGGTPREGMYASGAGFVNIGCAVTRKVQISETFNIPIKGSLAINPREENMFIVVGITL